MSAQSLYNQVFRVVPYFILHTTPLMNDPSQQIEAALAEYRDDADAFVAFLRTNDIPHLSYSSLTTVEACPYRYYLEYVRGVRLDPPPQYFVKGKCFHQLARSYYQSVADARPWDLRTLCGQAAGLAGLETRVHLANAAVTLQQNAWTGWEVVAVEAPFVLPLASDLPPCVGVIDLILRQGSRFLIVDHKTGSQFGDHDSLQMVIYREHIRRAYAPGDCRMVYDSYRWVNNLSRIRKPALQRVEVHPEEPAWERAVERFRAGYRTIRGILDGGRTPRRGACFLCPWRGKC